jgi:predicted RNA-binding Zn-ribbon protein involved in translation (DUF1610 family)
MKLCNKCNKPLTIEKVLFRDECPHCGIDLHVCLNCLFYDEGKANRCRESQADYVKDRDRANYCDYFRFNDAETKKPEKQEAEKLWKELFKKS